MLKLIVWQVSYKERSKTRKCIIAIDYQLAIRKVQENQVGLKLNRTLKLLVYADDVNLLWDGTDTVKKNIETLTDASKEVCLKVNAQKTNYTLLFHHQNVGKYHDIKKANESFDNETQLKYLGTTVTNKIWLRKNYGEIGFG
jgi:hypothetical protein